MSYLNKYLDRSDVVVAVSPALLDAARNQFQSEDIEVVDPGDVPAHELQGRRCVSWLGPIDNNNVEIVLKQARRHKLLPVVGLTGKAGSGKDTAAQTLVNRGFCKIALADAVKRAAMDIYGYDTGALWGASEMRNCAAFAMGEPRARHVLQQLGTEFGRALRKDTWIVRLFQEMDTVISKSGQTYYPHSGVHPGWHLRTYTGFVVPDVRFNNEAEAIRKVGGIVLSIDRPEVGPSVPDHASEQGVYPGLCADIIFNDEGVPALHAKVEYAVKTYLNSIKES